MPAAPTSAKPVDFTAVKMQAPGTPFPAATPRPTQPPQGSQLDDASRAKLDGIVMQMASQNAPQEDVQAVVNDFKQKYGGGSAPATTLPAAHPIADFARSVYSSVASPVLNMIARPGQAAVHVAGNQEPQSGDLPIGFGATAHINDPYEDIQNGASPLSTVTSDIGRGAQTVGLGLGPVAGGAAFGGGAALEQNKPILPTLQGETILDKAGNLATDNVLGSIAVGAGAGKLAAGATRVVGSAVKSVGKGMQAVGSGADALYGSAQRNIERVLAPTTKANKIATEKLAPQAARTGLPVSLTRNSLLTKLNAEADSAGTAVNSAWANLPANAKVKVTPILDALQNEMDGLKIKGANGDVIPSEQQPYFKQLETKAAELKSLSDETGHADAQAVRSYRQSLDSVIAKNKSASFAFSPTDTANMAGTKLTANTTRNQIAKQIPGVAGPNRQFNFFNGLSDILDATITRKTGQGTPLGEKIFEGAGAAGGFASHGLTGGIEYALLAKVASKVVQSTAWQTASAAAKKSLADAIAAHDGGAIANAIKTGFRLTGTGLEHVGNFISGIPGAAKTLPRQSIPGTTAMELRRIQPGLSTRDITKLHPEDHDLLVAGYEAYKNGTPLSASDELNLTNLLDHIGIRTNQPLGTITAQMKSVLDGARSFRGTDLRNLTGPTPRKSLPPATSPKPRGQ